MPDQVAPDMSCIPFRRRGLYLVLTGPFIRMLRAVVAFLWTVHPLLPALFVVSVCPACAIRSTSPAGVLGGRLRQRSQG